ncbi:MAG: alpha/beta hydrolase [Terracidiphilus sp.]|nr:alpha/beta hydrolase [Terracidiphilus sp.]
MKARRLIEAVMSVGLLATGVHGIGYAQLQPAESSRHDSNHGVKNIVLVHGAWADGSSWASVIPILEAQGYHVAAAQLPLTTLEDDDDAAERAIARITAEFPGPVLLVGHSYGGVVIGDKPGNDPNVAGLVYIAAFAPDTGESAYSLLGTLDVPPPISRYFQLDASQQFLTISSQGVASAFAQDLSGREQVTLTATQGPISLATLKTSTTVLPAWRVKPTWFIVAAHDKVITSALEQRLADRMNATTLTLPTCHVVMLQDPLRVAEFIVRAATSIQGQ